MLNTINLDKEDKATVAVELDRYEQLIELETKYWLLIKTLLNGAKLAWNKHELTYDDDRITWLLQTLCSFSHKNRLHELRVEIGEEEDDNAEK